MSKEKQIEEMAKTMCIICRPYGHCPNRTPCTMANIEAEKLYDAGYRKQRYGEWKRGDMPTYGGYKCSACGGNTLHYKANYCPNCGAKMKGGAE